MQVPNDNLTAIKHPEIVIGLVGPIGIDMKSIVGILSAQLKIVGYKSDYIHLTDMLKELA